MSYPMVHLSAAWLMLEQGFPAASRADFLLGAAAPDAIHYAPATIPATGSSTATTAAKISRKSTKSGAM